MMAWQDDIRSRFPAWGSAEQGKDWPEVKAALRIGQAVGGKVIAHAPFGVWIDIDIGFPALLLVVNMRGAKLHRITFEDYPAIGSEIDGRIDALGNRGEIGLTQERPEDDPWHDPTEFAVGNEFLGPVVRVMDYGCFVQLKPGVLALLRPQQTSSRLVLGDEVRVQVESVDPTHRKVEVFQVPVS